MSIRSIRLRNFRGYANVTLGLKPLTVLLGPNSSGKSSFSHPLAALMHCQRIYSGQRHASLTPDSFEKAELWPIDLGGYPDLVTSGSREKVYIDLLTSEGWVEFGFGLVPVAPDELWLSHMVYPPDVDTQITTGEGGSSSEIVPIDEGKRTSGYVPSGDAIVKISPGTNMSLDSSQGEGAVLERINEQQWRHKGKEARLGLDGLLPLLLQDAEGREVKFNARSLNEIRSLIQNLVYLRASRERPRRGYPRLRSEQKSIGYSGERTPSVLLNRGGQTNKFICPPNVTKHPPIDWQENETTLQEAASQWLRHIGLAHSVYSSESCRYGAEYIDIRVTRRPGGASRDITEVGFAISQVLPVVVGSLLQPRNSLFIVDLPEAHLHPKPQAEIADLFCSLAMCGRSALVETHSEMFFHRLRLRAAMDPELMNRIAVYFIDAPQMDGSCAPPREVGLTFEQELTWPAGFFQEALESEIQLKSVRKSQNKNG